VNTIVSYTNEALTTTHLMSVRSVTVDGHKATVGCMCVYDLVHAEEIPVFVQVKHILYHCGRWLVCGMLSYASRFDPHYHVYCLKPGVEWAVLEVGHGVDWQNLSLYKLNEERVVVLQHRICNMKAQA